MVDSLIYKYLYADRQTYTNKLTDALRKQTRHITQKHEIIQAK
jgi:hypothetical protein